MKTLHYRWNRSLNWILTTLLGFLGFSSCEDNGDDPGPGPNPPDPDPTPTPTTAYLTFATKKANQISVKEGSTD